MDFLTKELVDTFTFSTINVDRSGAYDVNINGRTYTKYGTYQAVTLVGNLYKVFDPSTNNYKKVLLVGMSKQHPCDTKISKETAYEIANENAQINPVITMQVGEFFKNYDFRNFCRDYVMTLKLSFVKTRSEIMNEEYERVFKDEMVNSEFYQNNITNVIEISEKCTERVNEYINKFNR